MRSGSSEPFGLCALLERSDKSDSCDMNMSQMDVARSVSQRSAVAQRVASIGVLFSIFLRSVIFVDGRVVVKGECTRQVVVSRRTASPDFCVPQFSELHLHDGRPASLLCASEGLLDGTETVEPHSHSLVTCAVPQMFPL